MPRAIVIDDSLTVRMDLEDALHRAGFEVVLCASVAQGRDALRAHGPSVIVLDVVLPDGDGVELLREIRAGETAAPATTPVLLLSSEGEVRDRIRGLATGADEYVGKPYDAARVAQLARALSPPEASRPQGAPRILVVDDSLTFRERLRELLEQEGYVVTTAETGEQGLRDAAQHPPALVIVDGVLPGIDGPTVIRRIRLDAVLRHVPCMLLTASFDRVGELSALDSGADAFVRKDEDPDIVIGKVRTLLRSASRGTGVASTLLPKRILAVDDSATYLDLVAEHLRLEGHEVVLAQTGEEALALLAHQKVDCVLLDLVMPGLSGEETCRRLKDSAPLRHIPVIMLTAREDRAAMLGSINAGADDYVPKSSDFEVLRARLRAQLRRRQFEEETRLMREELLRMELETMEAKAARELAEVKARLADELNWKNQELEAFSYSVSHDLRAPLRAIDGFTQALVEDFAAALPPKGHDYARRIRAGAQRMGELIDDLLALSQVGRAELVRAPVDVSSVARSVMEQLRRREPDRVVRVEIQEALSAEADRRLLQVALENLLGNAWKFTAGVADPRIELAAIDDSAGRVYVVRDNGAGFDMRYVHKLFLPFKRLHLESEFPGTGIGLATVRRVVERHGGRIWAESEVGRGAAFFFTVCESRRRDAGSEPDLDAP